MASFLHFHPRKKNHHITKGRVVPLGIFSPRLQNVGKVEVKEWISLTNWLEMRGHSELNFESP